MTAIDIPGYVIRREVGVGGMASVHLALQTSLDRDVALKVMAPALASDPTFSKRFLQEARMLASLAHPNIVQVYDVGVTQSQLNYFSMQYLPGGDFAQRVRLGLSEKELIRVLEGIANALGYAHHRGYVHRDVAPGNILFDANDTPLLTDFGIARAFSQAARITSAGISVGTSHYMSPEQARGSDVDARSDLYGLGVLVWFGLTGKPPYEGADGFAVSYAHVFEPIPRLPAAQAHWQDLVDKALAKDPAERFQNAEEFIAALGTIQPSGAASTLSAHEAPTRVIKRESLDDAMQSSEAPTRIGAAMMAETAPSPSESEAPADSGNQRAWLPWALAGAGVLLIGSVGFALLAGNKNPPSVQGVEQSSSSTVTTIATATPSIQSVDAADAESPVAANPQLPSDELFSDPGLLELDLSTVPTVVDPVAELVRRARIDLAGMRLTNPPRMNAFERFSLALKINSSSRAARQGIVDTAKAYLDLAEKSFAAGNLEEFAGYLDKAEEVAESIDEGTETVAEAKKRRNQEIDRWLKEGRAATTAMDVEAANAAFEKALLLDPDNKSAREGLAKSARIGKPGYVFHDKIDGRNGPELVVTGATLAFARHETTRGEYSIWWRAAGQREFGNNNLACRDRESFFRSSRKRDWKSPDIKQSDNHPVVCVRFAEAQAYAKWISAKTSKRYRLPTPAEWEEVARKAPTATCKNANLADAAYRKEFGSRTGSDCDDGHAATAPVGSYGSVAGVFDIDGNVREWVAACGKSAPLTADCRDHGLRGRGWVSAADKESVLEQDSYSEDVSLNSLGFRLVRELDK
ncbi:MAG TPA: bifunctional serine/threonine-protein kinase/formylglycine-generating enzyme family protein [Dokdonella sp.]|uniref:bifunctional serine/threonine-protein kinase/formylglycine-generating enzyme family protein n=1 Tax=Dokdonella sp. TaxID=2291710 RepID=UPI002D80D377|nr:bifunctional serine/threonine-protein kinase/formylglycine-generating enzyme family protein [Dokdonella sp.]HET9031871.1 bifunctional serine/threonine-protein kinase/formylglycine-generating enzyme family protein [Dokdonella sp.]